MRNLKLLIQYDGTPYAGWQRQPNIITIQQVLEDKLSLVLQETIAIIGSGRTDSGVHALGQVANFKTQSKLSTTKILYAINSTLPKSIRVLECHEVSQEFHARFSAIKREYKYIIYNDIICPPFIVNYIYHRRKAIDSIQLNQILQYLVGEHDFSSFAASQDGARSKIRIINAISVHQIGKEIIIYISGNAFLRKMIRMIVGASLDILCKNQSLEKMLTLLNMKNRQDTYLTAPPHGLYLNQVWYNPATISG